MTSATLMKDDQGPYGSDRASENWAARAEELCPKIAANAEQHDRKGVFVAANFALLKEAGFFTALVPSNLGGGGASIEEMCKCIRILAASCGSTALAFSMHSHLVAAAMWRRQHQGAPTEGLLRRVASEGLVLVSSGGSDWLQSGGIAERVEGGFRVTARKPFASGSPWGDLLVTSAVYNDPAEGPTVLHFAVPLKGEGVSRLETWQTLGMRGTGSDDLVLDNVFLPDAAISGRRPAGVWHMLFHTISMIAFPMIYSAYAGLADGARASALETARAKADDACTVQIVGEMENDHLSMQLAHERMVALAQHGEPGEETTSDVMALRTLVGRHAIAVVTKAMEAAGGSSFYCRGGLERVFRDVQAARFHPLQEKQQLDFTGRVALGRPVDRSEG